MAPPLIIAHRTCPTQAPENTLAGVRAAVAAGAEVVEVDARLSVDGIPMVIHDAHLLRLGHRARRVSRLSSEELGRVRVLGSNETIPTLSAVLDQLGEVGIAIDVKDRRAVGPLLQVLDETAFAGRVLGWSEHRQAVHDFVAAARPGLEVALLRGGRAPKALAALLGDAAAWGAQAVSVDERIVDDAFVASAASMGLGVYTMVNTKSAEAIREMCALGVRGVITDWPELARR